MKFLKLTIADLDEYKDPKPLGNVYINVEDIISIQDAFYRQEGEEFQEAEKKVVFGSVVNLSAGRHTVLEAKEEVISVLLAALGTPSEEVEEFIKP